MRLLRLLSLLLISLLSHHGTEARTIQCKFLSPLQRDPFGNHILFLDLSGFYHSTCSISEITDEDQEIVLQTVRGHNYKAVTIENSTLSNLPKSIGPFGNSYLNTIGRLKCVKCGLNKLNGSSFTSLKYLEQLDISYGSYNILDSKVFSSLSTLEVLNVSFGVIENIADDAFMGLKALETLDLSGNQLKKLTQEMFKPLEKLTILKLSYNKIDILDSELFASNTALEILVLDHNRITLMNGNLLHPNTVLDSVDVSYNNLKSLDIKNMQSQVIDASNNQISKVEIPLKLLGLDIGGNFINELTCEGGGIPQIKMLNVSGNNLYGLGCISSMENLQILDYSSNYLGKLDTGGLAHLTELKLLNLRNTNVSGLTFGSFSHQQKLGVVDLSYNALGDIDLHLFVANTLLRNLYLDGNNMTKLVLTDIKHILPSLDRIGLGDNDFICLYLVDLLKQLNKIEVSAIVSSGKKVKTESNINGIRCYDTNLPINPVEQNLDLTEIQKKIDLILRQQSINTNNSQLFTYLSQLNNVVVAKQQTQEKEINDFHTVKVINVILIVLIVIFFIYKGYTMTRQHYPRLNRYTSQYGDQSTLELNASNRQ